MNRFLYAATLSLALASCSSAQLGGAVSKAALPPETLATITGLCRSGEPFVRLAAAQPVSATAKEIGTFLSAFCDPLLIGSVPVTADGNSANWLTENIGALRGLLGR